MAKKKSKIYIRRERAKQASALLQAKLVEAKSIAKRTAGSIYQRNRCPDMRIYMAAVPHGYELRDSSSFEGRRYSVSRQIIDAVDHSYVKYPVPLFLYRSMLSKAGVQQVFSRDLAENESAEWRAMRKIWQEIFLAAAQGRPVYPLVKGNMTRKELHVFLKAPDWNLPIENVLWAKARVAGLSSAGAQWVVDRLGAPHNRRTIGTRWAHVLQFFALYFDKMSESQRHQITDFIRQVAQDEHFCFKGRTLKSMIELSHDWHRTQYAGRVRRYISWPQRYLPWRTQSMEGEVVVIELTSNQMLADEGSRQRHCIFTYTQECVNGASRVLSFRWMDQRTGQEGRIRKRVTAELWVRTAKLIQIRGMANREATFEEMAVIQEWADAHGIIVDPY